MATGGVIPELGKLQAGNGGHTTQAEEPHVLAGRRVGGSDEDESSQWHGHEEELELVGPDVVWDWGHGGRGHLRPDG